MNNAFRITDIARELYYMEGLAINSYFISELLKLGRMLRKHHKLCEDYCNIPDFNPNSIDDQEHKIEVDVIVLNKWLSEHKLNYVLSLEFCRDPRGLSKLNLIKNTDQVG